MSNKELASALDEVGQAYDSAQKTRSMLEEKKKNKPWICTADSHNEADLELFAQRYNMPAPSFEFEDIEFTFEEEGSELDLAKKHVTALEQELDDFEKAIKADEGLLKKEEEKIRALNQELASNSKVDADIQLTLTTRKEELAKSTEDKNKALRSALSEIHEETPKNEAFKEKLGCKKSVLLFFLGVVLAEIVVSALGVVFDMAGVPINGFAGIFLMIIQPVLWFVPIVVSEAKINARSSSQREKARRAVEELNAKKAKTEQEIQINNENLASQIVQLEQEALAKRKENEARRLKIEDNISSIEVEISRINEELRRKASEAADGINRVNQAVKKVSELDSKFAHLREQELSEYRKRRTTAFLEHTAPLREAFDETKEREMAAYTAELADAEKELERQNNRMQELLDKTAVNGKTYPLVQMGLMSRVVEIIRSGKADSWEEAIETLEAQDQHASTASSNASGANPGRNETSVANRRNLTRSQTKSVGKPTRNSGGSFQSASTPSEARSEKGVMSPAKGGISQPARAKNAPVRSSGFGTKPSPKPRPSGNGPSGRPRPKGGNAPSGSGRKRGTPKGL